MIPASYYEDLLRHGTLGPVSVGMSRQAVIGILGEPDDVGFLGAESVVLAFGGRDVQSFFESDVAVLITVYFGSGHRAVVLERGSLVLSDVLSAEELCDWMGAVSPVTKRDVVAGALWLEFESAVRAVFDADGRLVSLSRVLEQTQPSAT